MLMWRPLLLRKMLLLDGSMLCLDAIRHSDVASAVDATLDLLLLGYPFFFLASPSSSSSSSHSSFHPDVDSAIDVRLAANLNDDLLLLHYR